MEIWKSITFLTEFETEFLILAELTFAIHGTSAQCSLFPDESSTILTSQKVLFFHLLVKIFTN